MTIHRKRSRAFTLVELLVVIGIIAVLIGILLPVISGAQARARTTACMSNLRQIGVGLRAYANDNRDHYPDKVGVGNWSYRRKPGYTEPTDASSYPEWMGLAAALHGIRYNDYDLNMSKVQVKESLDQVLARNGRWLSGASNVWMCPAFPAVFEQYGNTYAYNINATQATWTSIHRSRYGARNILVVWDNSNFKPYPPGQMASPSQTGFTITPPLYPHPSKKLRATLKTRNELYYDGHVDTVTPP